MATTYKAVGAPPGMAGGVRTTLATITIANGSAITAPLDLGTYVPKLGNVEAAAFAGICNSFSDHTVSVDIAADEINVQNINTGDQLSGTIGADLVIALLIEHR